MASKNGKVAKDIPQQIDVYEWLKRWEQVLEQVSKQPKRTREFQFHSIDFWTWVKEWSEREMDVLITCLSRLSAVMKCGQESTKFKKGYIPRFLTHSHSSDLCEYANQWKDVFKKNVKLLEVFGRNNQLVKSTWEGSTQLPNSQAPSDKINISICLDRWDKLMEEVIRDKNVRSHNSLSVGQEFYQWVQEWQEDAMNFVICCLSRCESVMCYGKKFLISKKSPPAVFIYDKSGDLYRYADEWNRDLNTNKALLLKFDNRSSSHVVSGVEHKQISGEKLKGQQFGSSVTQQSGRSDDAQFKDHQWAANDRQSSSNSSHGHPVKDTIREQEQIISDLQDEIEKLKRQPQYSAEPSHGNVQMRKNPQKERLMRTKSAYQHRKGPGYMEVDDLSGQLLAALEQKDAEISRLKEENRLLSAETDKLSSNLSKMMHQELSRDESVLENISIKNRPMKIAEEYQLIQSSQWLEAKQALDDKLEFVWNEKQRNKFLMDIMMESYNGMKDIFSYQRKAIINLLEDPVKVLKKDTWDKETKKAKLTTELEQAMSHYQKIQSQAVDFKEYSAHLVQKMISKYDDLNRKEKTEVFNSTRLTDFCQIFCSLTWKMVVQTPPMTFGGLDIGEPIDVSKHEPHWGSYDNPGAIIIYYICPTMYHSDQVMAKGKVFLGNPKSTTRPTINTRF